MKTNYSSLSIPSERFDKRLSNPLATLDFAKTYLKEERINVESITLLEGGFNNTNFLLNMGPEKSVLRIYPADSQASGRELAVLKLANVSGINVPQIISSKKYHLTDIVILSYLEGELLTNKCGPVVFEKIGSELAKIHSVQFSDPGFIKADGTIEKFDEKFDVRATLIDRPLNGRAGRRLGVALKEELISFLDKHWHLVRSSPCRPCLVHCDYNPKNIIVSPDQNHIGILDWEYAMVGDPLIDLGNFLRFEEDFDPALISAFIDGYIKNGGSLPDEWRLMARLHDLVSMISFLDREEECPKTFHTALYVIEKTIRTRSNKLIK